MRPQQKSFAINAYISSQVDAGSSGPFRPEFGVPGR
jgi:hypothetical protein